MAVTTLTGTQFVSEVASVTLPTSGGITATSTSDGWLFTLPAGVVEEQCLFIFLDDGSGANLSFLAGTNPPSKQAAKGAFAVALAASETKGVVLEAGRHIKTAGTIQVTSDDAGTKAMVWIMPKSVSGGGTSMA